jgi:hypothetical protein
VGVNSDESLRDVRDILEENGITWPSFFDGESGPIAAAWEVKFWPTIYLIDHEGNIAGEYTGDARSDALIEKLVQRAEAAK